jgi:hypothetical protein
MAIEMGVAVAVAFAAGVKNVAVPADRSVAELMAGVHAVVAHGIHIEVADKLDAEPRAQE